MTDVIKITQECMKNSNDKPFWDTTDNNPLIKLVLDGEKSKKIN